MKKQSRIKNSIRNCFVGVISQVINLLITFISRTIFIKILGSDYIGINGLFANILSILSLAELGIGSAITYSMYKPLQENDQAKINALMKLYSKAYFYIGIIVAVLGLSVVPFLKYIIKDMIEIPNIRLMYILFLSNSVLTYFFAYKRSLIIADQKGYIDSINRQTFFIIQNILQIIILIITKSYILYLIIQVVCTVTSNIVISKKVDKLYPHLSLFNSQELDRDSKGEIFKNIIAMMSHKIGGVVVFGTDNILISSFVGIRLVGLYSNYNLIISSIKLILSQIFNALTASVGNLNSTGDKNKSYQIFEYMFYMNFWIYGFCSICLGGLLNPFIKLWLGNEYLLDKKIVLILVINFLVIGMQGAAGIYKTTLGLFWKDRYKALFEAAINLFVSIILLKIIGFAGVFLGTLISTLLTNTWIEPYLVYKYGFDKPVSVYFKKYIKYIIIIAVSGLLTYVVGKSIQVINMIDFLRLLVIYLIVPNISFLLMTYKDNEFEYFKTLLFKTLKTKSV